MAPPAERASSGSPAPPPSSSMTCLCTAVFPLWKLLECFFSNNIILINNYRSGCYFYKIEKLVSDYRQMNSRAGKNYNVVSYRQSDSRLKGYRQCRSRRVQSAVGQPMGESAIGRSTASTSSHFLFYVFALLITFRYYLRFLYYFNLSKQNI